MAWNFSAACLGIVFNVVVFGTHGFVDIAICGVASFAMMAWIQHRDRRRVG